MSFDGTEEEQEQAVAVVMASALETYLCTVALYVEQTTGGSEVELVRRLALAALNDHIDTALRESRAAEAGSVHNGR